MKRLLILSAVVAGGLALGLYLGGRKDAKATVQTTGSQP